MWTEYEHGEVISKSNSSISKERSWNFEEREQWVELSIIFSRGDWWPEDHISKSRLAVWKISMNLSEI